MGAWLKHGWHVTVGYIVGFFVLLNETGIFEAPTLYEPAGGVSGRTTLAVAAWLLLKRGVEVYEYQPTKLHTKLIVVDDVVHIGSANFDMRSLYLNLEIVLRIDPGFGQGHHEKVRTGGRAAKFGLAEDAVPAFRAAARDAGARIAGLHATQHLGVLEYRVDDGRRGVGHGIEAGDIRPRHQHRQIRFGNQFGVALVRVHDVVDQRLVFIRRRDRLAAVVTHHLPAQLQHPRLGAAITRQLHQELGSLLRDQHVEDVQDRRADVLDILAWRLSGQRGAELIDHQKLHRLDDGHLAADRPVAQ